MLKRAKDSQGHSLRSLCCTVWSAGLQAYEKGSHATLLGRPSLRRSRSSPTGVGGCFIQLACYRPPVQSNHRLIETTFLTLVDVLYKHVLLYV